MLMLGVLLDGLDLLVALGLGTVCVPRRFRFDGLLLSEDF